MNQHSRILRGSARAATGLVVVGVCAVSVFALSTVELPSIERAPIALTVDTEQNTDRSFVCAGAFAELGADPAQPGAAVPTGTPGVRATGASDDRATLKRTGGGKGDPSVFTVPSAEPFAAAQVQRVETESLRGVVASACATPTNEQWLIGGGTTLGVSTTLSLGNPGAVPATVGITVFDEDGQVDAVRTAGVLVGPGMEQTISLNGYAPDRERLAVRVESTGAPVTASLGVGQTTGIQPFAISSVDRQTEAATSLVIPGVSNTSSDPHGPSDAAEEEAHDGDEIPVLVRAMAPGGESGSARVFALDGNGKRTELGTVEVADHAVGELRVKHWPEKATAVVVESDVPVIAGALGSTTTSAGHDNEWFAPAPESPAAVPFAAPVVDKGRLVVANLSEADAELEIAPADGKGKARKVTIEAGSSSVVRAPSDALITSSAPVHAAVRYLNGADIAGYPILPAEGREGKLAVYPR